MIIKFKNLGPRRHKKLFSKNVWRVELYANDGGVSSVIYTRESSFWYCVLLFFQVHYWWGNFNRKETSHYDAMIQLLRHF